MRIRYGYWCKAAVRIAFSLICASLSYSVWMAVFLIAVHWENWVVEAALWLLAPMTTAAGFATGVAIMERRAGLGRTKFVRILVWPLIGCVIGAGSVFRFGPMLIVFGMLAAGTASVTLVEVVRSADVQAGPHREDDAGQMKE